MLLPGRGGRRWKREGKAQGACRGSRTNGPGQRCRLLPTGATLPHGPHPGILPRGTVPSSDGGVEGALSRDVASVEPTEMARAPAASLQSADHPTDLGPPSILGRSPPRRDRNAARRWDGRPHPTRRGLLQRSRWRAASSLQTTAAGDPRYPSSRIRRQVRAHRRGSCPIAASTAATSSPRAGPSASSNAATSQPSRGPPA